MTIKRRLKRRSLPVDETARNPNCELCPLWESAQTICFWGQGPSPSSLMIVAESPSYREDETGQIFTGAPGKLLQEALAEADITDYYFTHAVKCKPPEDDKASAVQVKTCKQYLEAEVTQVKPEYILTLGATALKSLGKGKITEVHGCPADITVSGHSMTLYPTFHPAVALRDPTKLGPLKKDLNRLGRLMRGEPSIAEKDVHWQVINTMSQWNDFVEEFKESPEVSIDTETTGLDREAEGFEVNALQIGLSSERNFVIPFNVRSSPWNKKFQRMFLGILVDLAKGKVVVMQNGKFDNLNLRKKYGMQFFLTADIMLMHHLLDENSPHGLDSMAMHFLDAPNWDIDLQTKLGLGDLEKFFKYGCYDVYYTLQLYYIFRAKLLKQPGLRRLFYKLVMPIARVFEDVESDGHFINLERLEEVRDQLEGESAAILKKLNKVARINWNSPAQIGRLFFEDLKMPVLEKTPTGAPSTAESTLLRLEHPVAKQLMEYRGVEKNLSTYVLGWQGLKAEYDKKTGERTVVETGETLMHGDRLFLSTKLHGTVTGRYASRLHQVPRVPLIRSMIDAPGDEGWVLVVADYSQIELRLAAMVSNDPRMKMIFQTGGDVHASTASEILGKDPLTLTKEERKMGKPVNFGFLYGMGWAKFGAYARDSYGVIFTDNQSKAYRKRFFEVFNALPDWHERQRRCVRLWGEVVSLSGRIRHLPGINSTDQGVRAEAERQGINSPIQGFGSGDLKAMAMVEIHDTFDRDTLRIKGEVHDSILFWAKRQALQETLPRIKAIMESPQLLQTFKIRFTIPLVADFEVGAWGMGEKWEG